MKLLFLTHHIPCPTDKGDKSRAYKVLQYLSQRHEIFLVCLVDHKSDLHVLDDWRKLLPHVSYIQLNRIRQFLCMLKSLFSNKPFTVSYFYHHTLRKQLELLTKKFAFEAFFVYSSAMAEYINDVDVPLRLVDFGALDSEKFKQYSRSSGAPLSWFYFFESKRFVVYEKKMTSSFDHVLFISQQEKNLFNGDTSNQKIKLLSNGIDFKRYHDSGISELPPDSSGGRPYLVFTGALDYLPNIDAAYWFSRFVFPHIKAALPPLQLYIIGRNPVNEVLQLHDPLGSIFVTSYIDDLRSYIKDARVFVAPSRIAHGMQTKVFEAMACGVPVVTNPDSANRIGAIPGQEILIAESASDYVHQTLLLLVNNPIREKLRKQAFHFLKHNFSWERNLRVLDTILDQKRSSVAL